MRIAIWRSGHEIADTVADAIKEGIPDAQTYRTSLYGVFPAAKTHIGYGILRGMAEVFRLADKTPYFNIDRGYFHPSHYSGYYRISLRGTQHTGPIQDWMLDDTRLQALALDIKPWRGFDATKPVLVCPPTDAVCSFFGFKWWNPEKPDDNRSFIVRQKGDTLPINFSDYNYVLTFNSSLGWQALQAGIPCVSDPTHSMVGRWFHNISLDDLADAQYADRHKLFAAMANLQLSLQEMRDGMLWPLMSKLLAGSR